MRGVALLWSPLGRVQTGRLPRVSSIPWMSVRRLLWVAALVGTLGVAGSASAGAGGELAGRGLALNRELASVTTGLFTTGSENACEPNSLTVPAPDIGDERLDMGDFWMIEPGCDDW
jgi:hypothetical protein